MRRRLAPLFLLAPLLASPAATPPDASPGGPRGPGIFYVATNGNDNWSGELPSPNRAGKDGPFATLPRALQAVRQWKGPQTGPATQAATIFMRAGLYLLPSPLVLTPEDSGLSLAAYRDEQPVLSGGRRITGWKPVTLAGKQLWSAQIPKTRDGPWPFRELWVNGRRATRARHPHQGYLKVASLLEPAAEWTKGQNQFRFEQDDLHAWKTVTNAEVIVMNRWVESRLPVTRVDEVAKVVEFGKRSVFQLEAGDPYYVEGAFEFLAQPGEWYLDSAKGTLYYLPRAGERPANLEVIAPQLPQLVHLTGKPAAGQFVERLAFRGLTFAHTEWCFPEGFDKHKADLGLISGPKADVGGFGQAAVGVPAAIQGTGVRLCSFEGCSFTHMGTYGLELAGGCVSNRLSRCDFSDLGAGGLKLGETAIRSQPFDQTRANEISDCHFHDGGKMFASAVAIWLGQSPDNRILHNLIEDFYYTGISIGWTWGYGTALASNNLVAFNHVRHIGKKSDGDGPILSDMGGIYTLGGQPGTRIINNLWHDIAGLRYGGWGIYFDEGSSGILAESNVVYRTTHGGFHQHYGQTNTLQNNIFAFARDHQIQRTRAEPHLSFSFVTNIVYFDSGVLLGGNWAADQYRTDWNIYFDARTNATPESMRFANATLEQWRARGHDLHSLIADPLFRAAQQYDFRLQTNSPALPLGFQPIDLTSVGIR
ncbi:MAG TPA: right-handed parallel beta-helix repeat-containing protein [Candidatus Binatia bacterium]|nr:right-handed parallel beta-helix repeat-containing protein [Candidatus Binatia bacterium]